LFWHLAKVKHAQAATEKVAIPQRAIDKQDGLQTRHQMRNRPVTTQPVARQTRANGKSSHA
jgi:hypothetical protein